MRQRKQIIVLLIASALLAILAPGCGSSDSSSSSQVDSSADSTSTDSPKGAVAEFGKNQLTTYGNEADAAEREAASSILEENMQARADGDWAGQCSTLSAEVIKSIEKGTAATDCAKALEAQAQPLSASKAARANTMTGPIAALRVESGAAFALYHGTKGVDYVIPMIKEGADWKVAAVVTQEVR
jgi:hypothetical protein